METDSESINDGAAEDDLNWCNKCRAAKDSAKHTEHLTSSYKAARVRIADGLCRIYDCGQPIGPSSSVHCISHFELGKKRVQVKNLLRQEAGMCLKCGAEPVVTKTIGSICIAKQSSLDHLGSTKYYQLLLDKITIHQGGCCFACGVIITLGRNTNFSHLSAVSRSGMSRKQIKKITKIDDLIGLCKICNKFQSQDSWEEFKGHCEVIFDKNINRADLDSDPFAKHVIQICYHLKLRQRGDGEIRPMV